MSDEAVPSMPGDPRAATRDAVALVHERQEALARRAERTSAGVRAVLDERLAQLRAAHVSAPTVAPHGPPDGAGAARGTGPQRTPLSALLEHLAARAHPTPEGAAASPPMHADAGALDEMRRICTRVRSESRTRQALTRAPANAGPLNSGHLVHRALTLMREVSPGYLEAFMAHVETLAWLEDLSAPSTPAPTGARSPAPRPKRPRTPRTPRATKD